MAIVAALLVAGSGVLTEAWPATSWYWLVAGLLPIAWVSFLDDRGHVKPGYRLIVQVVAATLLAGSGFLTATHPLPGFELPLSPWLSVLVALLFVVWMTNLFNFMDGMDGFAGGMAVIGFSSFAIFGALAGDRLFAGLSLVVVGAAAGFLTLNFPPARLFMGDLGSSSLGFLAAGFSLWGAHARNFPLWAAVLAFSPFIVDASVTLIRRTVKAEKIWEAHCSHFYQRLVRLGWSHRKTVLWEYLLMLLCAISAILAVHAEPVWQWLILSLWLLIYIRLMLWVGYLERVSENKRT